LVRPKNLWVHYSRIPVFVVALPIYGPVKSWKVKSCVIPAKAGIQCFQKVMRVLDSGLRRNDDCLKDYQYLIECPFFLTSFREDIQNTNNIDNELIL